MRVRLSKQTRYRTHHHCCRVFFLYRGVMPLLSLSLFYLGVLLQLCSAFILCLVLFIYVFKTLIFSARTALSAGGGQAAVKSEKIEMLVYQVSQTTSSLLTVQQPSTPVRLNFTLTVFILNRFKLFCFFYVFRFVRSDSIRIKIFFMFLHFTCLKHFFPRNSVYFLS